MKIFIDTADLDEIKEAYSYGILDGVTTNPSLIKEAMKTNNVKDMESYIKSILKVAKGTPVSLEVIGTTFEEMVSEGKKIFKKFNAVAGNVCIKIPANPAFGKSGNNSDGIKAIKELSRVKIPVNCTLVFTPEQALIAAKAGAKYISPFAGRIDSLIRTKAGMKFKKTDYYPMDGMVKRGKVLEDNGILSGVDLIGQCVEIIRYHELDSMILAASMRNARQVRECALVGADIATVPFNVLLEMLQHQLTKKGMEKFTNDIVPEYARMLRRKK